MLPFIKIFLINSPVNDITHRLVVKVVNDALDQAIASFKFELSNYNWKPFLSLIPDDCEETSIIRLTRNKPTAVLYNDITNLLNNVRVFPLWSVRDHLVQGLDAALATCFEQMIGLNVLSPEMTNMQTQFCEILVPQTESNTGKIFQFQHGFKVVRSHPRFITKTKEVEKLIVTPPPSILHAEAEQPVIDPEPEPEPIPVDVPHEGPNADQPDDEMTDIALHSPTRRDPLDPA